MGQYKAFAIGEDGKKTEIKAESIVIELDHDKCVALDLNPHPNHFGGLPIIAPANNDVHSLFNIKPGASNVIHLYIESIKT